MRGVVVSRNPSVPAPSSAYAVGLKRATVGGRSPAVPPEPRRGMVLSDAAGPLLLPHLTSPTTNGGLNASAGSRRFTRPWLDVYRLAMHAPTSSPVSTSRRPSISRCSAEASQWPKTERDQDMPTRLEDDGLAGGSRLRIGHERHVAGLADAHDQRPAGPVVLVEQVMRLDAVTGQVV